MVSMIEGHRTRTNSKFHIAENAFPKRITSYKSSSAMCFVFLIGQMNNGELVTFFHWARQVICCMDLNGILGPEFVYVYRTWKHIYMLRLLTCPWGSKWGVNDFGPCDIELLLNGIRFCSSRSFQCRNEAQKSTRFPTMTCDVKRSL